jgi:hypothetical protein
MQPEEIYCDHPHEAVPFIIQRLGLENVGPRLIHIEGTMLAGKSSLGCRSPFLMRSRNSSGAHGHSRIAMKDFVNPNTLS